MKKTAILISLAAFAACQQQTDNTDKQETISAKTPEKTEQQPDQPQKPAAKLPGIEIYAGRTYDKQLQKELDERNAKHQEWNGIMTLEDASIHDTGHMTFKDSEGNEMEFASWPYDKTLRFVEDAESGGEQLHASCKGKKYNVTYSLKAFYLEPAAQVVEELVVKKMVLVK